MPNNTRNEKVKYAVSRALRQRGITHKMAAQLLDIAESTVGNKISLGCFSESDAARWSAALGIEPEVFLEGREPLPINDYDAIRESMSIMRQELEELKQQVGTLLAWKAESY